MERAREYRYGLYKRSERVLGIFDARGETRETLRTLRAAREGERGLVERNGVK